MANVSVVAGLDGTYGFQEGAETLTGYYGYAPENMRAAVLDVRRATSALALKAIHDFHNSDRFFVTLANVLHGDFTTFVVMARAFHLPPPLDAPAGWTRETGYLGFRQTCSVLRDFLDAKLKGDPKGTQRMVDEISSWPNATVYHEDVSPPPE